MRRILKDIVAGKPVQGDVTTMEDVSVIAALQAGGWARLCSHRRAGRAPGLHS